MKANKDRPFFLYYSVTLPHAAFQINDQGIYKDEPWTEEQKNYAAMVIALTPMWDDCWRAEGVEPRRQNTRDARGRQRLIVRAELAPRKTLRAGRQRAARLKRELYEGGLRNAGIARWPGVVPAGRVSDEPWAFWFLRPAQSSPAQRSPPAFASRTFARLVPQRWARPKREYF